MAETANDFWHPVELHGCAGSKGIQSTKPCAQPLPLETHVARSRQDRLRYAPRAKLRAQPRQETRANFSLKRNCSRRSLLDKKKKKPQKTRAVLGSGVLSCLSCRSREAVSNKTA